MATQGPLRHHRPHPHLKGATERLAALHAEALAMAAEHRQKGPSAPQEAAGAPEAPRPG